MNASKIEAYHLRGKCCPFTDISKDVWHDGRWHGVVAPDGYLQ